MIKFLFMHNSTYHLVSSCGVQARERHSYAQPPTAATYSQLFRDLQSGEVGILDFTTRKNFRISQYEAELEIIERQDCTVKKRLPGKRLRTPPSISHTVLYVFIGATYPYIGGFFRVSSDEVIGIAD